MLTGHLQWEARSDWYCHLQFPICMVQLLTSAEYALNAVNQGVTALGIKGIVLIVLRNLESL